ELCGVEAVEKNRAPSPLGVADFAGEDRFARRFAAAIELKVTVADHLDQSRAQRLGGPRQLHIAGGIRRLAFRSQLAALFIHNSLAANDDDIFLKVIDVFDAGDKVLEVEWMFRNED